jgi:putative aminopeptidase FrvX
MVPVATGSIATRSGRIVFRPDQPVQLRPGHRVVFQAECTWDERSGFVEGHLDDAAGAAACLLAAAVLAHYPVEVLVSLADEEEAPAGAGNQTLSRGGKRLLQHFAAPELAVVVDSHVVGDPQHAEPRDFRMGDGASFSEKASRTRGGVVTPPLMELQRRLAAELASDGSVSLRENVGGYVPRSECVNAMERTPNVALVGFLNQNRHFDFGPPRAHIADIVHLARALVYYTLMVSTPEWVEFAR